MKVVLVLLKQARDLVGRLLRANCFTFGPNPLTYRSCNNKLRVFLWRLRFQPMLFFQIFVPIFVGRTQRSGLRIAMLTQNVCEPSRCLDPSRIMIQAENNLLQLWILFQHPEHGVFRCATERHIAVLLPVLWVQSKKSQQINRCFEHISNCSDREIITYFTSLFGTIPQLSSNSYSQKQVCQRSDNSQQQQLPVPPGTLQ